MAVSFHRYGGLVKKQSRCRITKLKTTLRPSCLEFVLNAGLRDFDGTGTGMWMWMWMWMWMYTLPTLPTLPYLPDLSR